MYGSKDESLIFTPAPTPRANYQVLRTADGYLPRQLTVVWRSAQVVSSVKLSGYSNLTFTDADKDVFRSAIAAEFGCHLYDVVIIRLDNYDGVVREISREPASAQRRRLGTPDSIQIWFKIKELPKLNADAIVSHLYQPTFADELSYGLQKRGMDVDQLELENDSVREWKKSGIQRAWGHYYHAKAAAAAGATFSTQPL